MSGLLGGVLPYVYSTGNKLRGLLGDPVGAVQNRLADMNTRAGGLLALTRESAKEGLTQGPATNALIGLLADSYNPVGMTVWHGSPHTFAKFDASKIGTGEGAQAYGHGIYTAEAPEVARQYAQNVKDMGTVNNINAELSRLAKTMAADEVPGAYGQYGTEAGRQAAARYGELMAQRTAVRTAPGNLYKVDLPDDQIAKMLDWDKPLSQQPQAVRDALAPYIGKDEIPGKLAYYRLAGALTGKKALQSPEASAALMKAGVPGIRYLDGGSRGAAGGTSNFVVFPGNEGLLNILERQQVR